MESTKGQKDLDGTETTDVANNREAVEELRSHVTAETDREAEVETYMDEDVSVINENRRASLPLVTFEDEKYGDLTKYNSTQNGKKDHIKIYVTNDEDDDISMTGSEMEKMYPNMGVIDDEHELSKPRNRPESRLHVAQLYVKRVVEHIVFRIFTILLIIAEFVLVVLDLAINSDGQIKHINLVSQIIIGYFVLELFARMFYKGELFFHSWMDILDMIVVLVTFVIDLALSSTSYPRLGIIGRSVRIMRIVRGIYLIFQQKKHIVRASRRIVSQNKRRYIKDGFDLDLCYITGRVIAMSFPSSGMQSMYRNNIREVSRFFESKHKGHYKIYNACSEREYDITLFDSRVERILIDDHNVPTLREMIRFCKSMHEYLSEDPENVAAIHCKGGKGRTGTLICTWLVECGEFEKAEDSLDYFGDRRTDLDHGKTFQGVETPSQSRYVGYYSRFKSELGGELPKERHVQLTSVFIHAIKGVGLGNGRDLKMEVWCHKQPVYRVKFYKGENTVLIHNVTKDFIEVKLQNCPPLSEDIKIRFLSKSTNIPTVYDGCAFYFWFHTGFEGDSITLSRDEIDNPHKKKAQKVFRENFSITLNMEPVNRRKLKLLRKAQSSIN